MRPVDPRLRALLWPARRELAGVVAASVAAGLLVVAQAFATGTLVVELVGSPTGNGWHGAAWWLGALVLARAVAGYAVDACAAAATTRLCVALRHRLLAAAAPADAGAAPRRSGGELTVLATRGVAAVGPYLTRYLPALVTAAVLPPVTVAAVWWLDWLSGLVVLLTLPLVPMFAVLIGWATRSRADRQWRRLAALSGHFLDVVRGLPTLVVHRRATAQSATIRAVTDRYRRATVDTLRLAFASSAVLELVATVSVALVAVEVGLRLAAGSLGFWPALVVLLLAPEAYWPLRRVGAEYHAAAEGTAALRDLDELFEHGRPADRPTSAGDDGRDGSAITLHDLTVRYPRRRTPALSGLTATIPGRGLTAITGPSGCGKSTLLAALLGEVAVESGEVRVGGRDLRSVDPVAWHAEVAWAPQRPWLTSGSIADNLRVGRPHAGDDELWAALDRVALAETVAALPLGLATPLGEDGAGLSAGQRARLALARVVLADRPYVFLDEPTAHLDAVTESVLLDTLTALARRRAVVVVAHRPAVAAAAEHVLALPAPGPAPEPAPASVPQSPAAAAGPRVATPPQPPPAPARWGLRTGTLLGTLSVASGVALTATASWLITRASEHPPVLVLAVAIVGVRTFGLARPALRYVERIVSHDAALRLLADHRARVYDALVPLVPGRLGRRRGDVLASVVDDVDSLVDDRLRVRQPTWTALAVGALATALAGLASAAAAAVTAGVVLAGALGGPVARAGVAAAEPDFVRRRAALSARVAELLAGARDLVLWGGVERALTDVDRDGEALGAAYRRSARAVALGRTLPLLAAGGGVVAMAAVVPTADAGGVSAAMLALLVMLPVALVDALMPLPDAGALAVRTAAARARLDALAATPPAVTDPVRPRPVPSGAGRVAPAVDLDQVTAGWDRRDAVRGLTLTLPAGGRVGLVGPSGSGKSTVAALLVRFLDPHAGRVCLGGADLHELRLDDLRSVVGLVDDDPHVFASSVLENVRLARPDADEAAVAGAVRAAHLDDWVATLPDGLRTMVGEGHAQVSGGERARLAVARAMLARTPVLVLDEPTAHLDHDTAVRVSEEVLDATRDRSVLWITHGTIGLGAMHEVVDLGRAASSGLDHAAVAPGR